MHMAVRMWQSSKLQLSVEARTCNPPFKPFEVMFDQSTNNALFGWLPESFSGRLGPVCICRSDTSGQMAQHTSQATKATLRDGSQAHSIAKPEHPSTPDAFNSRTQPTAGFSPE